MLLYIDILEGKLEVSTFNQWMATKLRHILNAKFKYATLPISFFIRWPYMHSHHKPLCSVRKSK